MRLVMLYRPKTEHEREVEEYVREFQHRFVEAKVELMSLDTQEGDNLAKVYDIVAYPAILALSNDGQLLKFWTGMPFPLMNEVVAYQAAG